MVRYQINRNWSVGGVNAGQRRTTAAQWALLAAGMVLLLPIMALVITALLVGIVVFALTAMVLRVVTAVRRVLGGSAVEEDLSRPDEAGRVNVRVIRDRD